MVLGSPSPAPRGHFACSHPTHSGIICIGSAWRTQSGASAPLLLRCRRTFAALLAYLTRLGYRAILAIRTPILQFVSCSRQPIHPLLLFRTEQPALRRRVLQSHIWSATARLAPRRRSPPTMFIAMCVKCVHLQKGFRAAAKCTPREPVPTQSSDPESDDQRGGYRSRLADGDVL